jgi:hypothetical protein
MILLILINCCHILVSVITTRRLISDLGLQVFGNIEHVGGILKILMLFVIFVLMMCINNGGILIGTYLTCNAVNIIYSYWGAIHWKHL